MQEQSKKADNVMHITRAGGLVAATREALQQLANEVLDGERVIRNGDKIVVEVGLSPDTIPPDRFPRQRELDQVAYDVTIKQYSDSPDEAPEQMLYDDETPSNAAAIVCDYARFRSAGRQLIGVNPLQVEAVMKHNSQSCVTILLLKSGERVLVTGEPQTVMERLEAVAKYRNEQE